MLSQNDKEFFLIVGLGNPGTAYENTRHNIGFAVAKFFSKAHGLVFHRTKAVSGHLALGEVLGKHVAVLLPLTYMNSSGEAVRLGIKELKVAPSQLMVICDDIDLPFGSLRIRAQGGSGGHKGLKSIEEHLQTQNFPRLRIGVGDRLEGDLADHVLGTFTQEESGEVPAIIEKSAKLLETWLTAGLDAAQKAIGAT